MKKFAFVALAALAASAAPAFAADMPVKARPMAVAPAAPPAWDIAFGSGIASDYIFRGITQSNHKASVAAYFEPRYNINKDNQLYIGIAGASISFPNRAAAEIDFYGGWRPTFGKLAFDFGAIYYYYPGGQCFNTAVLCTSLGGAGLTAVTLPNGNVAKADVSFWEVYAKASYSITDALAVQGQLYYSPSVLNSGADGLYVSGAMKYTFPAFSNGVQVFASGEVGYWDLGTSDAFYAVAAFPAGIPYKDYTTWNVGFGWTYKVFTVDLRYYDTDLNKGDCNAFTSDHTAGGISTTPINPAPLPGSSWCGSTFVAKLSADLTLNTNVK